MGADRCPKHNCVLKPLFTSNYCPECELEKPPAHDELPDLFGDDFTVDDLLRGFDLNDVKLRFERAYGQVYKLWYAPLCSGGFVRFELHYIEKGYHIAHAIELPQASIMQRGIHLYKGEVRTFIPEMAVLFQGWRKK